MDAKRMHWAMECGGGAQKDLLERFDELGEDMWWKMMDHIQTRTRTLSDQLTELQDREDKDPATWTEGLADEKGELMHQFLLAEAAFCAFAATVLLKTPVDLEEPNRG